MLELKFVLYSTSKILTDCIMNAQTFDGAGKAVVKF